MPRLPDEYLNCLVYIFDSKKNAKKGSHIGGSGFLCGIPSKKEGSSYLYIITNRHVINACHEKVFVRLNQKDGGVRIVESTKEEWELHPDGDDVALIEIQLNDSINYSFVIHTCFLNDKIIGNFDIGAGDDAFLIGRFAPVTLQDRNLPTVRFGNLMSNETMMIHNEQSCLNLESYLVEVRSIGGMSGSPVLLSKPPFSNINGSISSESIGPWLLGINYGHLLFKEAIYSNEKETVDSLEANHFVKSNSGTALIAPSYKIIDLLNNKRFTKSRGFKI